MKLLEWVNLKVVDSLKGKDLLTLLRLSKEEVEDLIQFAVDLKKLTKAGKCPPLIRR